MNINRIFYFPLLILFFVLTIQASYHGNIRTISQNPAPICGTPQASRLNSWVYLEELKHTDYAEYLKMIEQIEYAKHFNSQNKSSRNFWAYNFKDKKYYLVQATLRKQGITTRIWVEDDSWTKGYVTQQIVDSVYQRLVNRTNSHSIDPNSGIIKIDTTLFGQPPNYDGDGILDFLILDIIDDFDSTASNSPFIAGYFSPEDQTNNPTSNKMDLMYLDSYPGIYFNGVYHPDRVMSTTAHEFQHLIHHHYDTREETWLNEGLSQLASTYCGYGLDYPGLYLQDTNQSLTSWAGEVKDYARVQLWTLYCAEQLDLNFIKTLVSRPEHGVNSFNIALQETGYSLTMDDVFVNWTIANWVNSTAYDPLYGYSQPEAQSLHATEDSIIYQYPQNVSGNVDKYAVVYHRFRGKDSLRVSFFNRPQRVFWLSGAPTAPQISEITQPVLEAPDFNENNSYVLALIGLENSAGFSYQVVARYSLKYFELGYDSGQPGINLLFSGTAANKFTIPDSGVALETIKFWNVTPDKPVRIHIYRSDQNNLPGSDIVAPKDTIISLGGSWVQYHLPQPIENLHKDDLIFVGLEMHASQQGLGYEDTNTPGYSFLEQSGIWYPLSHFQLGGEPADGVWLIRAIFSGLVLSDSVPQPPTNGDGDFHIIGHLPNPQSIGNTEAKFKFFAPTEGTARFELYDILGRRVVVTEKHVVSGENWFSWGDFRMNNQLSSGIYIYRITFKDNSGVEIGSEARRAVIFR